MMYHPVYYRLSLSPELPLRTNAQTYIRILPEKESSILRVHLNIIGNVSTMPHAWVIFTYNFDELITDYRSLDAS